MKKKQAEQIRKEKQMEFGTLNTSNVVASTETDTSNLKYPYAYDENHNLVSAQRLTREDKHSHIYTIEGYNEDGTIGMEEVVLTVCKGKRNYFRRYPKDSKRYTGPRVFSTLATYNESMLHSLVKHMIADGNPTGLLLPPAQAVLNHGSIYIHTKEWMVIDHADLEVAVADPLTGNKVKFDILAYDGIGRKLGIEVLVSHAVDREKQERLANIGIETVEVDFSDLLVTNKTLPDNIEELIRRRLVEGYTHTKWLFNAQAHMLSCWYKGLVELDMLKTAFDPIKDGEWMVWAVDKKEALNQCEYREPLVPLSTSYHEKYLPKTVCSVCPNCIYQKWEPAKKTGKLICSHSGISMLEILNLLTNLD